MVTVAEPTFAYPVFLDVHDLPVLVVGGGPIGARKVAGLAAAGAMVRLVATVVDEVVDRSMVADVRERPFEPRDLDGMRLVITATGDADTDRSIAEAARTAGIFVNAADQPADCDVILPAIVREGRVTVAVSTDGASPALAQHLRDRIAELLTPEVGRLADVLADERAAIRAAGGSTEDVDWTERIATALADDRR